MIRAIVKLQSCKTVKGRSAFVRSKDSEHSVVRGRIRHFQVNGNSWAHIRRQLKDYNVMGFTAVHADTVEAWAEVPDQHMTYGISEVKA